MTQELAKELFVYKDGILIWRKNNKKAGYIDIKSGYSKFTYKNKNYYVHRIIFLINYGYLPKYIDHIDGNNKNNFINNLRECTQQQNTYNSKVRKNNKLGIKGISLHKWSGLYRATARINNKCITIGYYKELDKAISEYKNFIINNHKEFAKLN
jgi:hypothetical protein